MNIVITGYTYTRENLFDVYEPYPNKEELSFILPTRWTAKEGTVVFPAFRRRGFRIWNTPAFFSHSHYPIIGGLLKGWMPFIAWRLIVLRISGKADVLFTAGEPNLLSTTYNALWAKILGMKHIFNYWENIPYEQKDRGLKLRIKKAIIRMNIALSDGAICGMHKAESILRTFHPKFAVDTFLHAGFDENRFRPGLEPTLRHQFGWDNKIVFLYVGAIGYRKGIHHAIRSIAKLSDQRDDLAFLIVGSGDYLRELHRLTDELGMSGHIRFIPWMDNTLLPSVYNSADIVLYPSIPYRGWEEQFGYVIAEASLCERPVISTRSGSIDEVLLDGETGIMVEPDNEQALTDAMARLIREPETRAAMGRRGREFIVGHFSNRVIASKLSSFFHAIART